MSITKEHFVQLSHVEGYIYIYLSFHPSRPKGVTKELKKSAIAKECKMSRSTLDKVLARLVEIGFIEIHSTSPLVIKFIDIRLNEYLEAYDGSDTSGVAEPSDDDGPGEYLPV